MRLVNVYDNLEGSLYFLYTLMAERQWYQNISHKELPCLDDHIRFVNSIPYTAWYVIEHEDSFVGSIYLTKHDEVGIFIAEGAKGKGIGGEALKELMCIHPRKHYLANINPLNINSINFFLAKGFNLLQKTYEYVPGETEE